MRSKQVIEILGEDSSNYSDLMVMKSAAGYYIGTIYNNPDGYQEPGSRDSEYFGSRELAEAALENGNWVERIIS